MTKDDVFGLVLNILGLLFFIWFLFFFVPCFYPKYDMNDFVEDYNKTIKIINNKIISERNIINRTIGDYYYEKNIIEVDKQSQKIKLEYIIAFRGSPKYSNLKSGENVTYHYPFKVGLATYFRHETEYELYYLDVYIYMDSIIDMEKIYKGFYDYKTYYDYAKKKDTFYVSFFIDFRIEEIESLLNRYKNRNYFLITAEFYNREYKTIITKKTLEYIRSVTCQDKGLGQEEK